MKSSLLVLVLLPFVQVKGQVASTKKVICYFPNWAHHRSGIGHYVPKALENATSCTHILYAFASLDEEDLIIKPSDQQTDINDMFYEKVVCEAKKIGAKPVLSLGGWSDSVGDKYSRMMSSADNRKKFVNATVEFLGKYKFEGLDICLEFPSCPHDNCETGNSHDKDGLTHLISELHPHFTNKSWTLSVAMSHKISTINKGYDLIGLTWQLDWVGLMSFDYHTADRTTYTAPSSALRSVRGDPTPKLNTMASVEYLIKKGTPPGKIVIGVPFYGQSYRLKDTQRHNYWALAEGPATAGSITQSPGTLAYYEILQNINLRGWTNVENTKLGAYAYKDKEWVSYNSVNDMVNKAEYVKRMKLGGVLVSDLSQDDFSGQICQARRHPLLTILGSHI